MSAPCASSDRIVHEDTHSEPGEILLLDHSLLDDLSPDAMDKLAASLRRQAVTLERHANARRTKKSGSTAVLDNLKAWGAVPVRMADRIRDGATFDAAVREGMNESGQSKDMVEGHYRIWLKADTVQARKTRRMTVLRMAPYATNLEIAARLGVHRNTVLNDLKVGLRE